MRLLLAIALAACAQIEPDVGAPLHAPCTNDDTADHTITFSGDIAAIIDEYHCKDCHTPTGKTPIGLEIGGLDLSSYDTLRAGGVRSMTQIIVPGMPCDSILLQKVSPGPPFGARMPANGPDYLEDDDLATISNWIAQGALDN